MAIEIPPFAIFFLGAIVALFLRGKTAFVLGHSGACRQWAAAVDKPA